MISTASPFTARTMGVRINRRTQMPPCKGIKQKLPYVVASRRRSNLLVSGRLLRSPAPAVPRGLPPFMLRAPSSALDYQ
jgi:hypothetical protein